VFEIEKCNIHGNRDKMLFNIMTMLEKQASDKPFKAIEIKTDIITPKKSKKTLTKQEKYDTHRVYAMTRQQLFKYAKENNIKIKATCKTEELRKTIKGAM